MKSTKKNSFVILWLMIAVPFMALCQAPSSSLRIDKNQIYGMYSGLALLMDVHRLTVAVGSIHPY